MNERTETNRVAASHQCLCKRDNNQQQKCAVPASRSNETNHSPASSGGASRTSVDIAGPYESENYDINAITHQCSKCNSDRVGENISEESERSKVQLLCSERRTCWALLHRGACQKQHTTHTHRRGSETERITKDNRKKARQQQ